jgi:glycerol-3-phosphate dehydrogenase
LSGDLEGQTRAAVRDEMARSLADVVMRRTGLGAAGPPPASALSTVLATLAAELDWGAQRIRAEREALARDYGARTLVT